MTKVVTTPTAVSEVKAPSIARLRHTQGGVATAPSDIGFSIVSTDPDALQKVFVTKLRVPHRKFAMIGSYALHRELHVLPPREMGMAKLLAKDIDPRLGVVAPFKADHPTIQKLENEMPERSSVEGTQLGGGNAGECWRMVKDFRMSFRRSRLRLASH